MTHSQCLAYLRRLSGDEQILECLRAMASSLHADDPTCEALDEAHDKIEAAVTAAEERAIGDAREADLWALDDESCRRAGVGAPELDAFVPRFLTREAI